MTDSNEVKGPESGGRRRFLGGLGVLSLAWLTALVYPAYKYLAPAAARDPYDKEGKSPIEGLKADEVAKPGQGKNAGFAGGGLIVFRASNGELKALSSKCTHAGCNVQFQGDSLICHCHGGIYDLEGKNVSGPPPKPLTPYRVLERDGLLFVLRPENT